MPPASSVIRWTMSSSAWVVTPGTTWGTSASRIPAARRPAARMPAKPSGPWSLIAPWRPMTPASRSRRWVSMREDIARPRLICTHDCRKRSGWGKAMTETRIWTAGLLVIGDEILSGRTQDRNVGQIATWLNLQGIRLAEVRVVPDDMERIGDAVNALRAAYDYLFTTGGIGPTHDDITVDAIAAALGVPVIVHPQARAALETYYAERG